MAAVTVTILVAAHAPVNDKARRQNDFGGFGMISTFLLQLGAGCLLGAMPVPSAATGRAFNRFIPSLSAVILILGLGAAWSGRSVSAAGVIWLSAVAACLAAAAASHVGRLAPGRQFLWVATASATAAVVFDAFALANAGDGASPILSLRYVLDALSSAWLLGSILIAMILGHYYLNITGLAIKHLIRLCVVAMAAVGLRTLVFAWGLAIDGPGLVAPMLQGNFDDGGTILSLVVLAQRLLFGIAGTAALTVMAWRTAKISATQSATGILYIGFISVLVGELASRYLLFGTGRPL